MWCLSRLIACCLPTAGRTVESTPESHTSTSAIPSSVPTMSMRSTAVAPDQDGYNSIPLPAYTPHPTTTTSASPPPPPPTNEKLLAQYTHDPSFPSETHHRTTTNASTDEKQRLAWEEATATTAASYNTNSNPLPDYNSYNNSYSYSDNYPYYPYPTHPRPEEATSDVSSALSFPSSYGNTSTATRETPPPPYSPPYSPPQVSSPAPSRPMSVSSVYRLPPIAPPPPVFQRGGRRSIDGQLRERERENGRL
ncbi:hypothetical protein BJX61DRAFT_518556 [Aspergillus egyptiacus]|nr:hypothetical protein BJX61DRAFT_518556 [Aspergillus egyptiacus]